MVYEREIQVERRLLDPVPPETCLTIDTADERTSAPRCQNTCVRRRGREEETCRPSFYLCLFLFYSILLFSILAHLPAGEMPT